MKTIKYLFTILFSLAVAACGGGGGGGSSTTAAPAYSISGTVSGTTDVTISVTGGTANTGATTDTSDNYAVTGLNDGNYTVTPSKTGYTFTPSSRSVSINGANMTNANFAVVKNAVLANISGTVTGKWFEGVTITMSGDERGTTTTDAAGNYHFDNLPSGASYTFTPALAGYTYAPASQTVAVTAGSATAVTVPKMVAASTIASYSISGTVSKTTTKTGPISIRVIRCSGCSSVGGTFIDAASVSTGAAPYTVRGLQPGNYTVVAEMDALGTAIPNVTNPSGSSSSVTVSVSNPNPTTVNVTVIDPPTVPALGIPVLLSVAPGNGSAFVMYSPPKNSLGQEYATSYKIYWGTDLAASTGGSATFAAQGDRTNFTNFYVLSGLSNVQMYFKMTALIGTTESPTPSNIVGPVTIGATTGLNTVSGAVTFPGTATGTMIVGLYGSTTGSSTPSVYFTRTQIAANPQPYSIAGVPDGSYFPFAVIDMPSPGYPNGNGAIDIGEISNINAIGGLITVGGGTTTTSNLTLSSASATAGVNSDHYSTPVWSNYRLMLGVNDGTKRAVAVTLVSGPNVAVPLDISANRVITLDTNTRPNTGDSYMFKVTFSDGNAEYIQGSVTGVLDSFATNLAASAGIIPTFTWAAPSPLPSTSYIYRLILWGDADHTSWSYPQDFGLPSTTLSALYNADGKAYSPTGANLKSGNSYGWAVQVRDASGNSATGTSSFTVP